MMVTLKNHQPLNLDAVHHFDVRKAIGLSFKRGMHVSGWNVKAVFYNGRQRMIAHYGPHEQALAIAYSHLLSNFIFHSNTN
jgi:hypothetical protein